jgi:iron complex transport system ATP-binding protein
MPEEPDLKLIFENVSCSINHCKILEGISCTLQGNKLISFIGPNGAGKSTLFKIITGLEKRYSGCVKLHGKEINLYSLKELSKLIAWQPQHPVLPERMTVIEYLSLGRSPYKSLLQKLTQDDMMFIDDCMTLSGIAHLGNRYIYTLSGGIRQKVLLTECLIKGAKYIFLDEPFTFLDIGAYEDVYQLLLRAANEKNCMICCITHELNCAFCYSDMITGMKNGKIHFHLERQKNGWGSSENIIEQLSDIFSRKISWMQHPELMMPVILLNGPYLP